MNVLIANIGNRNISYFGKSYSKGNPKTFRDWSEDLLSKYPSDRSDLDINLINPLINSKKYSKIYFFYTNQVESDPTNADQDTLYEAELIKKILVDKYSYEDHQIYLLECNCKAIDNNALAKFYNNRLKEILRKNKDISKVSICEPGGTHQQKMALRIMAEFLFRRLEYEFLYPEKNKFVSIINGDEYRSVINKEIAIQLLHNGDYNAIIELLNYQSIFQFHNCNDKNKKLFAHTYFRFTNNIKLSKANHVTLYEEYKVLSNYYSGREETQSFKDLVHISEWNKIAIIDKVRKANFYFKIKRYSESILAYSQFYESLFSTIMKSKSFVLEYGKINKASEYYRDNIKSFIKEADSSIYAKVEHRLLLSDLSTQCLMLQLMHKGPLEKFAIELSKRIEYAHNAVEDDKTLLYINRLRNKVAHEGLYITEEDIKGKYIYYKNLLQYTIDILKITNIDTFENLNQIIEAKLLRV